MFDKIKIVFCFIVIVLLSLVVYTVLVCKKNQTSATTSINTSSINTSSINVSSLDELSSLISEGKQYKIVGDDEKRKYHYFIYDVNGKIVDQGDVERIAPTIHYITDNLLEIRFHGGTYAELCKYYDVNNNKFSKEFWNPFLIKNNKIVYFDGESKKLIIKDIFDERTYYKEFSRDLSLNTPPDTIELINEDKQLKITYRTQKDFIKVSETIDLT